MLCVKQGSIKYHFLSLWYDSSWDWTQVSQTIGELVAIETLLYLKTEKNPGYLRRLAVTQSPMKEHLQTLVLKNSQGAKAERLPDLHWYINIKLPQGIYKKKSAKN